MSEIVTPSPVINLFAHSRDCTSVSTDCGVEHNGYVPNFLGGGDDVELKIDVLTGKIINWDTQKALDWIAEQKAKTDVTDE